jgi:hypothetical protein
MNMEQLIEQELTGEIEVLGKNMPHCHFVQHKPHMTSSGIKPASLLWKAGD